MDQVATQFGIKEPKDWGRITVDTIVEMGGGSLIKSNKSSVLSLLLQVYPGS